MLTTIEDSEDIADESKKSLVTKVCVMNLVTKAGTDKK